MAEVSWTCKLAIHCPQAKDDCGGACAAALVEPPVSAGCNKGAHIPADSGVPAAPRPAPYLQHPPPVKLMSGKATGVEEWDKARAFFWLNCVLKWVARAATCRVEA